MLKPLDEVNRVYRRDSLRVSEAAVLPLIFAALESTGELLVGHILMQQLILRRESPGSG